MCSPSIISLFSGDSSRSVKRLYIGVRQYHKILDVSPFALFWALSMIGKADCGCMNPRSWRDVWFMLKLALPVTVECEQISLMLVIKGYSTVKP